MTVRSRSTENSVRCVVLQITRPSAVTSAGICTQSPRFVSKKKTEIACRSASSMSSWTLNVTSSANSVIAAPVSSCMAITKACRISGCASPEPSSTTAKRPGIGMFWVSTARSSTGSITVVQVATPAAATVLSGMLATIAPSAEADWIDSVSSPVCSSTTMTVGAVAMSMLSESSAAPTIWRSTACTTSSSTFCAANSSISPASAFCASSGTTSAATTSAVPASSIVSVATKPAMRSAKALPASACSTTVSVVAMSARITVARSSSASACWMSSRKPAKSSTSASSRLSPSSSTPLSPRLSSASSTAASGPAKGGGEASPGGGVKTGAM